MRNEKMTIFVYTDASVFIAEVTYNFGAVNPAEFEPYDFDGRELSDGRDAADWEDFGVTGSGLMSPYAYAAGADDAPLRRAVYAADDEPPASDNATYAEDAFEVEEIPPAAAEDEDYAALEESLTALSDFSYDGDVYDTTSRAIASLIVLLIISLWLNQ